MNKKILSKENVLIVISAALFMLFMNLITKGTIYCESPDGNLYLSVASNAIKNGHFIQTSRPYEKSFVVPFGLPLIFTVLYSLFSNVYAIVLIQYLIFGVSACLVKCIMENVFKNRIIGYVTMVLFCGSGQVTNYANPAYLLTETYTLFLLLLWIYIFTILVDIFSEKNVISLLIVSFILFIIRPAFSVFLILSLVYAIIKIIKKKCRVKIIGITVGVFALILAINVGINYRETKTFVFLENYSGIAIYQANNWNTQTWQYSSDNADYFVEDRFWSVENDSELTRGEKSIIYAQWAREYMKDATKQCIMNTFNKFKSMFIMHYGFDFYFAILAIIFVTKEERRKLFIPYILVMVSSLVAAMGLNIDRYSLVATPIYIMLKGGLIFVIIRAIGMYIQRKQRQNY